jgi:hypothetical protein
MLSMTAAAPHLQAAEALPAFGEFDPDQLAQSNINPKTGLATDFLNHFNEAIMLLEMSADAPDFLEDFLEWRPVSYREHFTASRLKDREIALLAYATADPNARHCLETIADTMNTILTAVREAVQSELPPTFRARLTKRAVGWLKPLVARAGAVINGAGTFGRTGAEDTPQAAVDALLEQ